MSVLGSTVVLLYHRVADPARDTHDLCVRPDRFAQQVEHLRRHERVVPLADARRPARRRRVVITFDDGYADNAHAAHELLEGAGLPATLFVAVGLVGATGGGWWDELELVVLDGEPRQRHVTVELASGPLTLDVGTTTARTRAHAALHRRLRRRRAGEVRGVLTQLRAQIDAPSADRASHRFITEDELRSLAASPVMDIGGHGVAHQQLSALTADEQRDDIVGGRRALEAMVGAAVPHFAYPYGGRDSFDATSEQLVAEAGYDLACVGWSGRVGPLTPRLRIPRRVVGDWTGDELAARLSAWAPR